MVYSTARLFFIPGHSNSLPKSFDDLLPRRATGGSQTLKVRHYSLTILFKPAGPHVLSLCLAFSIPGIFLVGCGRSSENTKSPTPQRSTRTSEAASQKTLDTAIPPAGEPASPVLIESPRPVFVEIAQEAGINFTFHSDAVADRFLLPEVMGGGAAWLDFDRDGQLDLYFANGSILEPVAGVDPQFQNALFRNYSVKDFRNIAKESGSDDSEYGQGCIAGDYDADGFSDLYIANYGPDVLLENNGDGTFTDVTHLAGVGDPRWSTSGVWFDADGDADLDLFVVNYLDVTRANNQTCLYGDKKGYCGPGRYSGVPDLVYLNQGNGTFREAADELGFNPIAGKGLAIVVTDFDADFLPDIYVANDMTANFLYTHRADPTTVGEPRPYREIAAEAGCAVSGDGMNEASMGISCADFDSDGQVDLYLTHYYQMKNTLYHNLGGMLFEDDSLRTGVAAASFSSLGFGTAPLDYDGDGAADLFIANGHVLGAAIQPNAMTPQLLHNDGKGKFSDVSGLCGQYFQSLWLGRSVASADYDFDGDTDLAVTHLEKPAALLRNDTVTGRGFLGLVLEGSNRIPPVGARVTVTTARDRQTQVFSAGGSYLSTSDSALLFHVDDSAETASIEIAWPSGRIDQFAAAASNRYWRITEGRSLRDIPR